MSVDKDDFVPAEENAEPEWLKDIKEMLDDKPPEPEDPISSMEDFAVPPSADWVEEMPEDSPPEPDRYGHIRPTAYVPYEGGGSEETDGAYYVRTRKKRTGTALIILVVVLTVGLIIAGWQLASVFLNYQRDRTAYEDLASSAISAQSDREKQTIPAEIPDAEPTVAGTASQVPIKVDWDYLRSVNSDIVGWLYCPNTVINYPVVQTSDHDFYLDHGFDRQSNKSGALFADRNSVAGILQSNFIIYGHNMKDKSMFGTFQDYLDESYYRQNPVMYYLTPDHSYRVELIGAHIVEGTTDNFPTYFSDIRSLGDYLDGISTEFYWINRTYFGTDYQLMTLSTCTTAAGYEDARLLIHGAMVPIK